MVYFSTRAYPPLSFIPPAPDPRILALVRLALPYWMKWQEKIHSVETRHVDRLVYLFQEFEAQQIRFIIAFRHPSPQDSFCLAQLLWYELPRRAQELGITLTRSVHVHFIYDRGIPLWAGSQVGWLYAKLGGTPIQRGKVDRQGLRSVRQLFTQGRWPLAAAPEGGNNGHTEIISPLEPGVAQMGFWCVEDLKKDNRPEQVLMVPLGITYRYLTPPWQPVDQWLGRLEQDTGLVATDRPGLGEFDGSEADMQRRYHRLYALGEHLLTRLEDYYRDIYGVPLATDNDGFTDGAADDSLGERLQRLIDSALKVAETYFQLPPRGSSIDRCRRIEQAGWDRIFRQDLAGDQPIPAVDRGLADRQAEEASLRMWHMRLVENFVAVTGQYVKQNPTPERFAETLLILRDTICLIQGETPFPRPKLGPQIARLTVGEPISISDRWPNYKANRKQAVAQLTADLQTALEAMLD